MKIKTVSPLSKLTEEDQEKLVLWVETLKMKDLLQMVAKPAPEGFGIVTHINTLRRFYVRYRNQHSDEDRDLAREISASGVEPADDYKKATLTTLQKMAFDISNSPDTKLSHFKALTRWAAKLSDQEQKMEALALMKQKLTLDIQKFQFNAARAALLHFKPLQRIAEDSQMDDEDKIRAARKQMFGDSTPE